VTDGLDATLVLVLFAVLKNQLDRIPFFSDLRGASDRGLSQSLRRGETGSQVVARARLEKTGRFTLAAYVVAMPAI
jgi:hypothetical protein